MVTEELKQRITAKAGKCKHGKARVAQYRQNKQTVSLQSERRC